jgi:glyoxylase-like metal-dependent hydrolase (beta-lactamase superfamily II)
LSSLANPFFWQASGTVTYKHADSVVAAVEKAGLHVEGVIETHAHADHLTGALLLLQFQQPALS